MSGYPEAILRAADGKDFERRILGLCQRRSRTALTATTRGKLRGQRVIGPADYEVLAEFRHQIAVFLRRRRQAAEEAGLEAQQYELLLAVKGHPNGQPPTIKQVAEQLQIQHHSAVELTNRLVKRGLVRRQRSPRDRRAVWLSVTRSGHGAMEQVARYSLSQLRVEVPALLKTLTRLLQSTK